jgi:hypothetical protein
VQADLGMFHDTTRLFHAFFKGCYDAGEQTCGNLASSANSAAGLQQRVQAWLASLDSDVSSLVDEWITLNLKFPLDTFRSFSESLNYIVENNITSRDEIEVVTEKQLSEPQGQQSMSVGTNEFDSRNAVVCGDAEDVSDKDVT